MKSLQVLAPDWQALSALLDEALALPPEDRAAWLERLRPEAQGLRARLRGLLDLQEDVRTRGFLESLPVLPGLPAPALAVQVGDQVGPYRLVDEIGRGGMGTVWLAERADGLLKRRCALKLPLLAWSDSLRDRMAQERDILASLDHPHIARLLDTGVDDQGRPFLALEHVQGEPIDAWMDARKLPLRERVALFAQVVDAIRYAHANLVIHRDLKPSNILVTAQGQAKLLDFGIAKLLSEAQTAGDSTDLTLTGQRLLTPRYASPEQILGQRLTAASDVYSLGVLLHELLCGQPPYAAGNASDKLPEQAVLEANVRAPSRRGADPEAAVRRGTTPDKLVRQLRGELDAIVLRALARVPQERYASAEAMQADLQAWLDGRPVQARNPGSLVVAWKFVQRHRWPVAVGVAGVMATVSMALLAATMAWRSEQESRRAAVQARSALQARLFLSDVFKGIDPSSRQGREVTLPQLLERAEALVESRHAGEPELRETVYMELSDLWAEVGDPSRRLQTLEKRSRALQDSGNDSALADNLLLGARVALEQLGDLTRAAQLVERFDALAGRRQPTTEQLFERDLTQGWLEARRANLENARIAFDRAVQRATAIGSPHRIAQALRGSSRVQYRLGRWAQARESLLELRALVSATSQGWSAADRRAVRWEVAQEMLTRGLYAEGWADAQALKQQDDAELGPYELRSTSTQRLWLRWCLAMREEAQAMAWLSARTQALDPERFWAVDPDWMLAAAEVFARVGDPTRSHEALRRADAAAGAWPPGEAREALIVRVAIARARVAMAQAEPRDLEAAVKALAPREGGMSKVADVERGLARAHFHAQLLRLRRAGREAVVAWNDAIAAWEAHREPGHPEAKVLRLNATLQAWEVEPGASSAKALQASVRALREALPESHPLARAASGLMAREDWQRTGRSTERPPGNPSLPATEPAMIIL